jgi:hypothetical protein
VDAGASWPNWRPAGLVTLADKGFQGNTYAKIPSSGMVRRDPCDAVAFPLRQAHWSRDR